MSETHGHDIVHNISDIQGVGYFDSGEAIDSIGAVWVAVALFDAGSLATSPIMDDKKPLFSKRPELQREISHRMGIVSGGCDPPISNKSCYVQEHAECSMPIILPCDVAVSRLCMRRNNHFSYQRVTPADKIGCIPLSNPKPPFHLAVALNLRLVTLS